MAIGTACVLMLGAAGCGADAGWQLGIGFYLDAGETARIAGEDLDVRFDALIKDSRCKPEDTCGTAGSATVAVSLAKPTTAPRVKVELRSNDSFAHFADYTDYRVYLVWVNKAGDELILRVDRR